MKNSEISKEIRFQVLWEANIRTIPTLMKYVKISDNTARRYAKQMAECGSIQRKSGSGGYNVTPKKVERKVIKKLRETKKPLDTRRLAKDTGVCKETVRKILQKNNWRFKRLKKKKLTIKQKSDREIFCKLLLSRLHDIPFIIWTDETSFWLNRSRPRQAWVCMDDDDPEDCFEGSNGIYSGKIHVWGGISSRGRVSLALFRENMDAEIYVNILKKKLNEINRLYPDGFIFMCDNDPKHKSKLAKSFYFDHFPMSNLDWPSYSPDLNPIENIWSWLKARVSKEMPQDLDKLENLIKKHWAALTPAIIEPYIQGMEDRFRSVLSNGGGYSNY